MSSQETGEHRPVLLDEVIGGLAIKPNGVYLDGTFGRGGHSAAILERLGAQGRLFALDKDPEAVDFGRSRFGAVPRFRIAHGSFAWLRRYTDEWRVTGEVDGLVLDLGVSSPQLDDAARGFSFMREGPLDMRMDPGSGPSVAQWLASASEQEIAQALRGYGEERHARRITRAIVAARSEAPIATTRELAQIVAAALPAQGRYRHPATRTFQALRIQVNRELEALEAALRQSLEVLRAGGRVVVIAFHSLEDRIVKRFFRAHARGARLPRGLPVPTERQAGELRVIGRVLRPSDAECARNPRARSARLRVAERLP
jgi:16S rRNA (cytosine1402-N4)-methyltransferase